MQRISSFMLNIVALVLIVAAVGLIVQNIAVPTQFQAMTATWDNLSLGSVLALVSLLMSGGILLKMWERVLVAKGQSRKANRELERQDVSREEAESKVKALEAKVATLEKALETALKRS